MSTKAAPGSAGAEAEAQSPDTKLSRVLLQSLNVATPPKSKAVKEKGEFTIDFDTCNVTPKSKAVKEKREFTVDPCTRTPPKRTAIPSTPPGYKRQARSWFIRLLEPA